MGWTCRQCPHWLLDHCGCCGCRRCRRHHCLLISSSYPRCLLIVDLAGHHCRGRWRPRQSTRPTLIACWPCPPCCPHSHRFNVAVAGPPFVVARAPPLLQSRPSSCNTTCSLALLSSTSWARADVQSPLLQPPLGPMPMPPVPMFVRVSLLSLPRRQSPSHFRSQGC